MKKQTQWLAFGAAAIVIIAAAYFLFFQPAVPENNPATSFIHFFYLPTCPHCHEQMDKLNPVLEQKYGIIISKHDTSQGTGKELFDRMVAERGWDALVPTTLVGNEKFVGYNEEIGAQIDAAVAACVASKACKDPVTGSAVTS
ncbi:Uncharacterised protein [Candidatus Norongarragalina meridionalis]|nr:Uncharacterised protein [Candidatus Norongarragalina meridionalis]